MSSVPRSPQVSGQTTEFNSTNSVKFHGRNISSIKESFLSKLANKIQSFIKNRRSISQTMSLANANIKVEDLTQSTPAGKIEPLLGTSVPVDDDEDPTIDPTDSAESISKEEKDFNNNQVETKALLREMIALDPNSTKDSVKNHSEFFNILSGDKKSNSEDSNSIKYNNTNIQFVKMPTPPDEIYQLIFSGKDLKGCMKDIKNIYINLIDAGAAVNQDTGEVKFNNKTYYFPPTKGESDISKRIENTKNHINSRTGTNSNYSTQ